MGTHRSRMAIALASTLGLFRSVPVFGRKPKIIGVDLVSKPDESVEAEVKIENGEIKSVKRTLPKYVRQSNIKLNQAEAKRYRRGKKALRDQCRVAAGMVC